MKNLFSSVFTVFITLSIICFHVAYAEECTFEDQKPYKSEPLNSCLENPPKNLQQAIEGNCLNHVKELINSGYDKDENYFLYNLPGSKSWGGDYTPLILAARLGRDEIVEYLISKGANVNVFAKEGCEGDLSGRFCSASGISPLFYGVLSRSPKIVDMILKVGISPNTKAHSYRQNVLDYVNVGDFSIFRLLIKAGANLNVMRDIHWIVGGNDIEDIISNGNSCTYQFLVDNGLTVLNEDLTSVLVSKKDDPKLIEFILNHGIDANSNEVHERFNLALVNQEIQNVIVLLNHGFDLKKILENSSEVCAPMNPAIVQLLLDHGLNPKDLSNNLRSVLFNQVDPATIQLLVEHGANILSVDKFDDNLISYLLSHNFDKWSLYSQHTQDEIFAAIQTLSKLGLDPMRIRQDKRSNLHLAAKNGENKIVKELLKYGSQSDAVDNQGRTPLFMATEDKYLIVSNHDGFDFLETVKLLISSGANVNTEGTVVIGDPPYPVKLTPLSNIVIGLMSTSTRDDLLLIMKVLLSAGADPNFSFNVPTRFMNEPKNTFGATTPLSYVLYWGIRDLKNSKDFQNIKELVDLLVKWGGNLNQKNEQGYCTLDIVSGVANSNEKKKLVQYIKDLGAVSCRVVPK